MALSPYVSDELTGLPGETHLLAQLERAYQAMVERRLGFAVLAVAPHDAATLQREEDADAVAIGLLGMAQVFRDSLRHCDGVGYLGDGRFLAYATQLRSEADTLALAQRIHDRLRWSFVGTRLRSSRPHLPISMGVSLRLPCVPADGAAEVVQESLQALAIAQQHGSGALRVFSAPVLLPARPLRYTEPVRLHRGRRWSDPEPSR